MLPPPAQRFPLASTGSSDQHPGKRLVAHNSPSSPPGTFRPLRPVSRPLSARLPPNPARFASLPVTPPDPRTSQDSSRRLPPPPSPFPPTHRQTSRPCP